jgi:hypothetical protein
VSAEPRVAVDRVEIDAPLDLAFQGVVRLVVGGIAEQANFGFEAMDDLQLAIERLLVETTESDGRVKISFELGDGVVRTRIGPLREGSLAAALENNGDMTTLSLARILSAVVDSFGVEPATDGQIVVRLEKLGTPRP